VLSAIIVSYRTPAEVAAAVASLHAQSRPPDEVVIVDNAAAEGESLDHIPDLGDASIVSAPANLGYGAGCNLGASTATGDELLMLNADVVLTAGATSALVGRLHSNRRIAVVGPRVYSGGELQPSARAFPSLRTGVLGRRSLLTRMLFRARRYPAELSHAYGAGGPVDWVSGACMLVRRSAFESVGGFDESYWMYWEDADLCRRMGHHGWRVHFEPSAVVHHATGASGINERTIRAFHESAALFASRHLARSGVERRLISAVLRARGWLVLRRFGRRLAR
jgi:N-acetylglucosaminyl-diphospho-decaprenol L-rhamnosyltransferase